MFFGGVPRFVFQASSFEVAKQRVLREIAEVPHAYWPRILGSTDITLPRITPDMLVHIHPEGPRSAYVKFASPHIAKLVLSHVQYQERLELLATLHAVPSGDEMTGVIRGHVLEERMHEMLIGGNVNCTLVNLRVDDRTKKPINPTEQDIRQDAMLPKMTLGTFHDIKMNDLATVKRNGYYRPIARTYPGIDSISIMQRKIFVPDAEPELLCAVGWQATVARVHGSKVGEDTDHAGQPIPKQNRVTLRTQLTRIRARVRELIGDPDLPLYLVFATTPYGINQAQKLAKNFQSGDDEFLQFAVRTDWFGAIQQKLGLPSPSSAQEEAAVALHLEDAEDEY